MGAGAVGQTGSAQPSNVNTGVGGKGGTGAIQNPTQNPYARQTSTTPTAPTSPYSAPTFTDSFSNNNPYANPQGTPGGKGGNGITQNMANATQGQGLTPQQWQAMQGMSPDQRSHFMEMTNQLQQQQAQPGMQVPNVPTSKGGVGQAVPQGLPGLAVTAPTTTAPTTAPAPVAPAPIAQAPTLATAPVIPPMPVKPVAPAPVLPTAPVATASVQQRRPEMEREQYQRRPEMEREQKRQDDRIEMEKRKNVIAQPNRQQELQRGIQTIGRR